MTEPFLGQTMLAAFNFPPKGYAACNGALMPINQNQALFSLLGTTYGGNGQTNFALPNLQGRTPIHVGAGYVQGQAAGSSHVTVNMQQMPQHSHPMEVQSGDGDQASPLGNIFAGTPGQLYHESRSPVAMADTVVGESGGSQPHENMAPYTVINACIAIQGIFPSRN